MTQDLVRSLVERAGLSDLYWSDSADPDKFYAEVRGQFLALFQLVAEECAKVCEAEIREQSYLMAQRLCDPPSAIYLMSAAQAIRDKFSAPCQRTE